MDQNPVTLVVLVYRALSPLCNLMTQTKRCTLLLPFLLRRVKGRCSVPLRKGCLESARAMLAARHALSQNWPQRMRPKLDCILHCVFYAMTILAIDMMWKSSHMHPIYTTEVSGTLQCMKSAWGSSPAMLRFCKELGSVLHAPHTNTVAQRQHSAVTAGPCQPVGAEGPKAFEI